MVSIKNKVFVKLEVPEIDRVYDIYLPVNKKIGNIINLLNQAIYEMTNGELALSKENALYNKTTKERYSPDVLLLNTSIRNGTVLILVS